MARIHEPGEGYFARHNVEDIFNRLFLSWRSVTPPSDMSIRSDQRHVPFPNIANVVLALDDHLCQREVELVRVK